MGRLVVITVDLPSSVLVKAQSISTNLEIVSSEGFRQQPERLAKAEIALVAGWHEREQEGLARARSLRWVQTVGAGVERLLTPSLAARGDLRVTNARGIHAQPIAEHVFGFLLSFTRQLHAAARDQASGLWRPESHRPHLGTLQGRTLGILGLGAIGSRIAEIATVFGLKVLALKRNPTPTPGIEVHGPEDLHQVLSRSDFIINALPLTREHPLWALPNVLITPHDAGARPGYFEDLGTLFLDNLERYENGRPLRNLVDLAAGY